MKNLEKKTKKLVEDEKKKTEAMGDEADELGRPKSAAGKIMQAVAKVAQNTPGKSGKKATKGPKEPSAPTSKRQKKDFKKSSKKDIPFDSASEPGNEEMD